MVGSSSAAGEWVLVCDGSKALVLKNVGDERFPNLRVQNTYELNAEQTKIPRDTPGRVYESVGSARSAIEHGNLKNEAEKRFLEQVAQALHTSASVGEIRRLIVVAPAKALGILRHIFSPAVRDLIHAEIERDFVHLPVYEIEKRVFAKS